MPEALFTVAAPVYEGPIDLLLHVVRQREVDLLELPLSQIAKDFLEYARTVEELDLDTAGEVIYIAAVLLRMKVRALLPVEEEEELPDAEALAEMDEQLEEIYREIVAAARQLARGEEQQRNHFPRGDAGVTVELNETEEMLRDLSVVSLAEAFRDVTRRMEQAPIHQLALFKVSVEDQSRILIAALKQRKRIAFHEIAERFTERLEAVVAFLAMLELIRYSRIKIRQDRLFGTIWIMRGPKFDIPPTAELED